MISGRSEGAPQETLLVIDARPGRTVSSRRGSSARPSVSRRRADEARRERPRRSGIAIAFELGLPVKFVGVGEGVDDLRPFDAHDYALALLGT